MGGVTKGENIHQCFGTRTHGKNITQNPANRRRRSLIGFYKRWMIVTFNLKDTRKSIAHIHRPRIFALTTQNPRSLIGKTLEAIF